MQDKVRNRALVVSLLYARVCKSRLANSLAVVVVLVSGVFVVVVAVNAVVPSATSELDILGRPSISRVLESYLPESFPPVSLEVESLG